MHCLQIRTIHFYTHTEERDRLGECASVRALVSVWKLRIQTSTSHHSKAIKADQAQKKSKKKMKTKKENTFPLWLQLKESEKKQPSFKSHFMFFGTSIYNFDRDMSAAFSGSLCARARPLSLPISLFCTDTHTHTHNFWPYYHLAFVVRCSSIFIFLHKRARRTSERARLARARHTIFHVRCQLRRKCLAIFICTSMYYACSMQIEFW